MRSEKLAMFNGAIAQVRAQRTAMTAVLMAAVGIQEVDLKSLCGEGYWSRKDAVAAKTTIAKIVSAGFHMSGFAQSAVIAEYLASVIALFVHPTNWPVAAEIVGGGLDGAKLLGPNGDEVSEREHVLSLIHI